MKRATTRTAFIGVLASHLLLLLPTVQAGARQFGDEMRYWNPVGRLIGLGMIGNEYQTRSEGISNKIKLPN